MNCKAEYVRILEAETVFTIRQGANDAEMLKAAAPPELCDKSSRIVASLRT